MRFWSINQISWPFLHEYSTVHRNLKSNEECSIFALNPALTRGIYGEKKSCGRQPLSGQRLPLSTQKCSSLHRSCKVCKFAHWERINGNLLGTFHNAYRVGKSDSSCPLPLLSPVMTWNLALRVLLHVVSGASPPMHTIGIWWLETVNWQSFGPILHLWSDVLEECLLNSKHQLLAQMSRFSPCPTRVTGYKWPAPWKAQRPWPTLSRPWQWPALPSPHPVIKKNSQFFFFFIVLNYEQNITGDCKGCLLRGHVMPHHHPYQFMKGPICLSRTTLQCSGDSEIKRYVSY